MQAPATIDVAGSPPLDRPGERSFLFLQGPHGRFFPRLGAALRRAGHRVHRINFNGGDRSTWPEGDNYVAPGSYWKGYLAKVLARRQVSDLVLYGDSRPLHAAAIALAEATGVRVHVFEEGYLRPDWVTLEEGGVNGRSRLPRDPAWYRREAADLPAMPRHPPLPYYGEARSWAAFFYHMQSVFQRWRFPFYHSHRTANPQWEGFRYVVRYLKSRRESERSRHAEASLAERAYFLFPLQLTSDYQIRIHSPFPDMAAAIRRVLDSFAAYAPATAMLAIKEHPLDSGLVHWRRLVERLAQERGVADRIAFLEQGDLSALIADTLGVVTVNSTSGTLALAAGKPVKVLGRATYDLPDLTDQRPLDEFWQDQTPPDPATYDAFARVLVDRVLVRGAFLSRAGLRDLIATCVARLTAPDPCAWR